MIRHSSAEREAGSWLPTETAQTRSCSWRLSHEKAKRPIPSRAPTGRAYQCPAPSERTARRCVCAPEPWYVPGRPAVAIFSRDASLDALPWQFFHPMHPKRGLGRERRPFLATYRRHASKTSWHWQDSHAMYPKSPANRRRRILRANILPGRGPFRCTDPSNHAQHANLAIRRRRTALALATPVPPNSASRPKPRHRPHGAAAFGTRHPTQRQTARTLATSAPPNGAKPPTTATPKRNSKANGMDWLHYVERFCENRESEKESARAKMPTFWQKRALKEKAEP